MSGSPAWTSGTGRRNPRSTWLWNRQGLSAEAPQDRGKQILLLRRLTQAFTLGTGAKQWHHRSLGQTYLWVFESLLRRQQSAVVYCGGKDTGGRCTREYSSAWILLELAILAPRPDSTQQPTGSNAGTPQAKPPPRLEHCPTHQQTGCLKSSWANSCQ